MSTRQRSLTGGPIIPWASIGPRNHFANQELNEELTIQTYPILHVTHPRPHLTFWPLSHGSNLNADGKRERFCAECNARITLGPSMKAEYGHYNTNSRVDKDGCSHWTRRNRGEDA